jgi:hypothetical protein
MKDGYWVTIHGRHISHRLHPRGSLPANPKMLIEASCMIGYMIGSMPIKLP